MWKYSPKGYDGKAAEAATSGSSGGGKGGGPAPISHSEAVRADVKSCPPATSGKSPSGHTNG